MSKIDALLFLADGFEEIEALATLDLLRRANINILTVSLEEALHVMGAHDIQVKADISFCDVNSLDVNMLILPGGSGHTRYRTHEPLLTLLRKHNEKQGYIAAICAASTVLGMLGILKNKTAVCFPGMENILSCKNISTDNVCIDGNIITSKAAGATFDFAFAIIEALISKESANNIKASIYY